MYANYMYESQFIQTNMIKALGSPLLNMRLLGVGTSNRDPPSGPNSPAQLKEIK